MAVDNTNPLAYGFEKQVDVMFDNSPVMHLGPGAAMSGVKPVAWFAGKESLRSGWAWGQHYLEDGVAAASATVGKGKVFLLGPEITFRAQPHGTFKFLFNGIYYGTSVPSGAAAGTTTVAAVDGLRLRTGARDFQVPAFRPRTALECPHAARSKPSSPSPPSSPCSAGSSWWWSRPIPARSC